MSIQVAPLTDTDFRRAFDVFSDAFGQDHEYVNIAFPAHETPAGREIGARRFLEGSKVSPHCTFLKAIEVSSGEMIGLAQWTVLKGVIPEETGLGTTEYWEDERMAAYADSLFRGLFAERRAFIRENGGNVVALDLLCVDPKHHRKGAGRALIRWGLQKADELGVDAVVEASDAGVPAYEAEGFKNLKHIVVEPPDEFKHRPRHTFHWMYRQKRSDGKP